MAQAVREEAPRQQTYVRTFPYFTGPAYGLLLDAEGPRGWVDSVRRRLDLQAIAARVVGSDFSSRDAERAGAAYGLAGILAAEDARWRDRERQLAELRARFVDGATLRLRPGALRISFDFRGQVSLGDAGTFMPHLIWRGGGGATLDAPAGGLVSADWGEIRLPLDTLPLVEGPLATDRRWAAP